MGQQPNVHLSMEDLPRPTESPDPPRRWTPRRPGEIDGPDDVAWGGMFGTPGPDTGFALRILRTRPLLEDLGHERPEVEAAIAALMGARASRFGRAPTIEDAEVAEMVLGLGFPDEALAAHRKAWVAGLGHDPAKLQRLVGTVDLEVLMAAPGDLRSRVESGERLFG